MTVDLVAAIAALKDANAVVSSMEPGLFKDLREALGLVTNNERLRAAIPDAELGQLEGLLASIGDIGDQLRAISAVARAASTMAELALRIGSGADAQAASNAQHLHKLRWTLEEHAATTIHARVEEFYEQKAGKGVPPEREHVRRSFNEMIEAAKDATTRDEEDLLLSAFLGSLTPSGLKNAIGARLRKLVTSGRIGPVEIHALRRFGTNHGAVQRLQVQGGGGFVDVFSLASTTPALVTVLVQRAGGRGPEGTYIKSLEQFPFPSAEIEVKITTYGTLLLRMLDESEDLKEIVQGSSHAGASAGTPAK